MRCDFCREDAVGVGRDKYNNETHVCREHGKEVVTDYRKIKRDKSVVRILGAPPGDVY